MKKIIAIVSSALLLLSCDKFLDLTPTSSVSSHTMWENTTNAEYAVNYLFTFLWNYNAWPTQLGLTESLTDELKYTSYNFNAMAYIPSYIAYGSSTVTAQTYDVYLGKWGSLYTNIREANEALNYLFTYGQMSDDDKTRLAAEIRFIRGFLYFELVKRYKDVIIYDEHLEEISKDKAVSTEEKAWDFIQADLNFAADNLPVQAQAHGRIDKGMAYGMITRAMLYAKRYDAVKKAADKVTELGYSLEPKYADGVAKSLEAGNREAIIQYTFSAGKGILHSYDATYSPGGDFAVLDMKGGAYAVPTQDIVESYELATGGIPDWKKWHASTTDTPPYALLEPRFQASILYIGSPWKARNIEPYVGGTDGWAQWKTDKEPKGKTVTGYYLKKNVDESFDVSSAGGSHPFTLLRYAEVLLNKAEACYRTNDADGANAAVKAIRSRVGLPYTEKSGDALWKAIVQERKVELAFEGQRYWDLRRWETAHLDYPEGLSGYKQHGLKIEPEGSGFRYSYVIVDDYDRNFTSRLYRFPIPESELSSNSLIDQYDEWK